ncbi:MAG: hypothetical protein ACE5LA_07270, partial [Dehalococcoidales bacterium]
ARSCSEVRMQATVSETAQSTICHRDDCSAAVFSQTEPSTLNMHCHSLLVSSLLESGSAAMRPCSQLGQWTTLEHEHDG